MRVAVYLGLGANLGDRMANLAGALRRLEEKVEIEEVSSVYETEPVGYHDQPRFFNAVARVRTDLEPHALLELAKTVEADMGRLPSFRNAPRPVDVDILLYDDAVIETPDLTVPHPRLAERAFVLVPLAEIAPDLPHPVTRRTVREMLAEVDQRGVVRWGSLDCETTERPGDRHGGR